MAQFKKGQSGNPAGRPRKGYALTDLLRTQLNRTAPDVDGKRHARKRILARVAVEAATTGSMTFTKESPSGELLPVTVKLETRDWIAWAKYIFDRIDGRPTQPQEVMGEGGGPIKFQAVEIGGLDPDKDI